MGAQKSAEGATSNRAVRKGCYYGDIFFVSAVGATPNKYDRCRSLAFPSAADLFDVQTSYPNNVYISRAYALRY